MEEIDEWEKSCPAESDEMVHQIIALTYAVFIIIGVSLMPPEVISALEQADIGEVVMVRLPRGDGCNSCEHGFRKTGDGAFQRLGISGCTVAHCLPPEVPVERYK
jgi:hypothetical protein